MPVLPDFRSWAEEHLAWIRDLLAKIDSGAAVVSSADRENLETSERELAQYLALADSADESDEI